ncbi:MAG: ATP-binding protein [Acidimicrobiales bacterium]|nr:ATP-binding protein [Acidimicrobiales bacterium]
MSLSNGLVARRVRPVAVERLRDDPVVLLEGPRSVGKSTLLQELAETMGAVVLDLDVPATRDAVAADPSTFVAGAEPVCIDEYQKAPVVLDAIKAQLNQDSRPGRFVLTGSTRHDSLPAAAQALTGRLSRLTVYPLAQVELEGDGSSILEQLFADPAATVAATPTSATTREEYVERVVAGGFPMALARSTASARARWFDDYVDLTLERDVQEISRIRQGNLLPKLLHRLAGQTAQVLNVNGAGRDVGLDHTTAEDYTRLLERVFLIERLPSWGKTLIARTGTKPKLHVVDSGVAARLLRLTPEKLLRRDPVALGELGHLLETFVVGEVVRQASWMDGIAGAGHWRTRDGDEVDLVLERDDGAILAFEVKAAARAGGGDFKPLRKLAAAVGPAFVAGFVLYTGELSYNLEDNLFVMPIDRLWLG